MGQQQLLLIVLGVIVVGIAVVVGINLFSANAESSAKDSIISQGTNIGALAQQYYKKPKAMGGGENNFASFAIPTDLATTADAKWTIKTAGDDKQIVFTGTPVDGSYKWTITTTVTPTSIKSE
jgi:hypothetical protein